MKKNKNLKRQEKQKLTDEDLLLNNIKSTETEFYDFGTFSEYNGLDVRNLKNPHKF